MPDLISPGVFVSVIDESQYGSAGQGTVPLLLLATRTNKLNVSASDYAEGTKPANVNTPYLLTSQRELVEFFGTPEFKTINGSVVQGGETNEYGLLTAYSYLGLANRAYVLRADVDLGQLEPSIGEPAGEPDDGTSWFDLSSSSFGLFEYSDTNGWVSKSVTIFSGTPTGGDDGDYGVDASGPYMFWKNSGGTWGRHAVNYASPHYSVPSSPTAGETWIKTTQFKNGLKLVVKTYVADNIPALSPWVNHTVNVISTIGTSDTLPSSADDGTIYAVIQNASSGAHLDKTQIVFYSYDAASSTWTGLGETASETAVTGNPEDGMLWYNSVLVADLFVKTADGWTKVDPDDVTIDSTAPSTPSNGDVWVDSSDLENYPAIYEFNSSTDTWDARDITDQTTPAGVVFADLTNEVVAAGSEPSSAITDSPDPDLYPIGMMLWNTLNSTGHVKRYDASAELWLNHSGNKEDGSPYMMRKAQRRAVVKAMSSALNSNTAIREEMQYFNIISTPGYPELLDEMISLNTDRKETGFIIVDTPFRLKPESQKILEWIAGTNSEATGNGEDGLLTTNSYAAAYYPSVLASDLNGNDVVLPASYSVLRTIAYNDQVAYPWFAPAGLTRGKVTNASNLGYINSEGEFIPVALTQGQRDTLYGSGDRAGINPIARFPGQGIFVFGQRTLQPSPSALDRVNVSRLVAHLRERFDPLARPFIFEPNDEITRANVKQVFDTFLADLLAKRAVYDYVVQCDETNNTPARIDRNELWVDVAIEPTKSAEFIYIPIRIVNTGELSA